MAAIGRQSCQIPDHGNKQKLRFGRLGVPIQAAEWQGGRTTGAGSYSSLLSNQAFASLRFFSILADWNRIPPLKLMLKAEDVVMISKTKMSNLMAQIEQDIASAHNHSQDVNDWVCVSSERASRINSLESKITRRNQIMHHQQDTIGQYLRHIQNLETEKGSLTKSGQRHGAREVRAQFTLQAGARRSTAEDQGLRRTTEREE
ncbi:MAG: hypothetical protein Q9224_004895 [Gallowayella concinna]